MPQVFKMGPYLVYFWSNENEEVVMPQRIIEKKTLR